MRYWLTSRAAADLEQIGDYIAEHNPLAAERLIAGMHRRWDLLCDHPFSGTARDDIRPGLRCLTKGNYLTLYRVSDAGIEIVRVLHAKRDMRLAGTQS